MTGEAESEEVKRAKLLEVEAVRAAEGGSLGDALELLNQAITVAPNYASPYNNRAQVREEERDKGGTLYQALVLQCLVNGFQKALNRGLGKGSRNCRFVFLQ
jgi:hypothetical protein